MFVKQIISTLFFIFLAHVSLPSVGDPGPLEAMGYKILNFTVLVGLLIYFVKTPIKKMLIASVKTPKEELDRTTQVAESAKERLSDYREKLAGLEKEIENMKASAKLEAEKESAKIISEAKALSAKIEKQTKFRIEQSIQNAKLDLAMFIADEAVRQAEKQIRDNQAKIDQTGLLDIYTQQIKEAK